MLSTVLWVVWVAAFAVLEAIGASDPDDDSYTLTNRIRALMRTNFWLRQSIRAAIGVGLVWLAWHFLVVDPFVSHGA